MSAPHFHLPLQPRLASRLLSAQALLPARACPRAHPYLLRYPLPPALHHRSPPRLLQASRSHLPPPRVPRSHRAHPLRYLLARAPASARVFRLPCLRARAQAVRFLLRPVRAHRSVPAFPLPLRLAHPCHLRLRQAVHKAQAHHLHGLSARALLLARPFHHRCRRAQAFRHPSRLPPPRRPRLARAFRLRPAPRRPPALPSHQAFRRASARAFHRRLRPVCRSHPRLRPRLPLARAHLFPHPSARA